ncbi:hypothetical protein HanIR_Chr14g0726001 [Helianthus annuus]|nr:hypothetical protein HanIR_Chr14g0726001 [Helianthus annuus]
MTFIMQSLTFFITRSSMLLLPRYIPRLWLMVEIQVWFPVSKMLGAVKCWKTFDVA